MDVNGKTGKTQIKPAATSAIHQCLFHRSEKSATIMEALGAKGLTLDSVFPLLL